MKLVKSLLLGSAAGLMAVTGSMAADLPSRKAAPAEFVRVCSAYGAGFFFIPGTETCLRISGQVRAEALMSNTYGRYSDTHGFRARARINLDARTQTGYGTLRTFIRYEANNQNGQYNNRGAFVAGTPLATAVPFTRIGGVAAPSNNVTLAFVQFAGITAGRYTSFFDFYGTDAYWNFGPISGTQGDSVNGFAYTATFGGGFSATLSLESRQDRELGLTATAVNPGYIGSRYPDVVGVLRLQQGWGTAQLMGAFRDVNIANTTNPAAVGGFAGSQTGYAIGAGVMFNLPSLAAGTQLYLEGVYARGAVHYLGFSSSPRLGYANIAPTDYAYNAITNTARLAEGYSLMAALRHFWTPTVKQAIFAGYSNVSYGNFSPIAGAIGAGRSFNRFEIGTNLVWSPVAGLDIGVEVLYRNVDPRGTFSYTNSNNVVAVKGKDSSFEGRFRIQRDF